jgi:hypothetical protein
LGVTDEMASGFALPPVPEAVPEFAGAAPHPESRVRRRQKDKTRRRKLKGPAKHKFIESADYRTTGWRASKKHSARSMGKTREIGYFSVIDGKRLVGTTRFELATSPTPILEFTQPEQLS